MHGNGDDSHCAYMTGIATIKLMPIMQLYHIAYSGIATSKETACHVTMQHQLRLAIATCIYSVAPRQTPSAMHTDSDSFPSLGF